MSQSNTSRRHRRLRHLTLLVVLAVLATVLAACTLLRARPRSAAPAEPASPPGIPQEQAGTLPAPGVEPAAAATPSGQPTAAAFVVPTPVMRLASDLVQRQDWSALAQTFDAASAVAEIERLCQPDLAGRRAGSASGWRAAEYLARRFAELGLQPAGEAGSYWQEFEVPLVALAGAPHLTLTAASGEQFVGSLRQHFLPIASAYTGSGVGDGRAIWVSDGMHDDYDGIDATGAVVICRYTRHDEVYRQAAEHGVGALLVMREDVGELWRGQVADDTSWISETIPAAFVTPEVVSFLLADAGLTLDDLTIQYTPLPLPGRATLEVSMRQEERARARNVLGLLPGRDPEKARELVVIGAHYDHLGSDSGGVSFPGANDDASGVSVLLEIARCWQAAGFLPERSVLFAAWDAEELGQLGSRHYVKHPLWPLTATVAMLQLDMVGAGGEPVLEIDGAGAIAEQAFASAAELGIRARPAPKARIDPDLGIPIGPQTAPSDHIPFGERHVPALMVAWAGQGAAQTGHHLPDDTPARIDATLLRQAGAFSTLLALHLSSTQPQIADLVARQAQALHSGDLESYLATASAPAVARERQRLERWSLLQPREVQLSLQSLVAVSTTVTASLQLEYAEGLGGTRRVADYPAQFALRPEGWQYDGFARVEYRGSQVRLLAPPGLEVAEAQDIVSQTDTLYGWMAQTLGLPPQDPFVLELYLDRADLAALHGYPAEEAPAYVLAGDRVILGGRGDVTPLLVQRALSEAGVPPGRLDWLAAGLADLLATTDPQQLDKGGQVSLQEAASAQHVGELWPLEELPEEDQIPAEKESVWRMQARSLVAFLLSERGWDGVGALARAAARAPTLDAACRRGLGWSLDEFEARWREAAIERWSLAAQGIAETLRTRSEAVAKRDLAAFLATVNGADSTLLAEQRHWLERASERPPLHYSEAGSLVELDGDRALASLMVRVQGPDRGSLTDVTYMARFVRRDGRWLYDDVDFQAHSSPHFTLLCETHARVGEQQAALLLSNAERAWEMLRGDWPAIPEKVLIKQYAYSDGLRLSVGPSIPLWIRSWTGQGESIRLSPGRPSASDLAAELARQALYSMGVADDWLLEGFAAVAAQRVDRQAFGADLVQRRRELGTALRRGVVIGLSPRGGPLRMEEDRLRLYRTQAWDMVSYLTRRYGMAAVRRALELRGQGSSLDDALRQTTGSGMTTILAEWRASAVRDHIDPETVEFANGFREDRALHTAAYLSGARFGGRGAGAAGGDAAARFLAAHLLAYGLEPAGDAGSYFQSFPISYTTLLATPSLSFADLDGRPIADLAYRDDFYELVRWRGGGGSAEGEVVWVGQRDYSGARLGSRIVLQRLQGDPSADLEA
ncbi:MAG: M28 family peptidase, partial [Anaerolineae bacterium]|nr:M28 family peptidase [Anaerolineae bacterium]